MRISSDENNSYFIPLIVFIPNFFINLFYIFNILDNISTKFNINNIITFTMFGAIISTTFIPFSSLKSFSEECLFYAKGKILPYKIISILLLIYIFITIFIFKDKTITFSAVMMTYSFFIISFYKKIEFAKRHEDDYKVRWQKRNSGLDDDSADPNIFWHFKIWVSPRVRLSRKRRPFPINSILFLVFLSIIGIKQVPIISSLILGYFLIYLIEYIFSLYVETKGFCTEVKYCAGRKAKDKWKITIIDYTNKRKIVFYASTQPYFCNGDYVRVVTGMFTKTVASCSSSSRTTY